MQELKDMIINEFNSRVNDGKIQETVSKKVDALINHVIDDSMRSYSDFTKAFEKKLQESLITNLDKISLPQYTHLIMTAIERRIGGQLEDSIKSVINKKLDDLLDLPPSEIKLSDIVEKYKEFNIDQDDCSCEYKEKIGFKVEEHDRYDWTDVYIHSEEFNESSYTGTSKSSADIRFTVNKCGSILSLSFGHNSSVEKDLFKKERSGLEKLLLDMYVSGAKVIIDEDDCDPYLPERY